MSEIWNDRNREEVVGAWRTAFEAWTVAVLTDPSEDDAQGQQRLSQAAAVLVSTEDAYATALPEVALSRCPWTGSEVTLRMDTGNVDGPWWNLDQPIRPDMLRPESMLVMTGAVKPGAPWPSAPFMVAPGPEVPFVIPGLLAMDGVRAVLSSVQIGPHTVYAVCYFGTALPKGLPLVDEWGTRICRIVGEDTRWAQCPPQDADPDFDLVPWLASGRLLWIQPGDSDLMLRTGALSCPYVGLAGSHAFGQLVDGDRIESLDEGSLPDEDEPVLTEDWQRVLANTTTERGTADEHTDSV